ncbi:MAG TPA: PilZ domain-containing protein, partial [Gemmataceae bacterium]|nr:PilZ domain-containing protein [Gemmataceae bacterium]
VLCRLLTNGAAPAIWTVQVRELSTLGISLILPRPTGIGQLLGIELTRKNGSFVRTVLARVVHEARESSHAFVVGAAFIKELEDEHLRFFRAGAIHPSAPDCRRWTRFPCNVETACYCCDTAPGERRSGRILNISAGGIGLVLRCQFSEGTLLHFELPQEMNLASPKILVRVVRVTEQGDGNWFLGCEFTDQLTDDELQALLR